MSESKDSDKRVKKFKEGVKLKTKPAVVPTYRKMKTGKEKIPVASMITKGITPWNIVFTTLFLGLLVATIINFYYIEFLSVPLDNLFLKYLVPVALILEVLLILVAFEAKGFSFPKIHTRHNVKRIMIVGFIIGSLLVSFFTPYFNLIGKYRDLPPGTIEPMDTNESWFDSLFSGDAPFYIDGILDLLDNMDLDPDLDIDVIAEVTAPSGTLRDFLYRWDIAEYYQSSTWDFIETSAETRFDLSAENYNPALHPDPPSSYQPLQIKQLVYSVQTSLLTSLISTWSNNYNEPFLGNDLNWTDNLTDENGTVSAVPGTVNVKYNLNDMLSLKATTDQVGFFGNFSYNTFHIKDDNITSIITNAIDYTDPALYTSTYNSTFSRFLQKPLNYASISPNVAAYAANIANYGKANGHSVYQQITYILEKILTDFGFPTADDSDNNGQDRAERLILGTDSSVSAYIALAIMTLRLNNIPCRPVIGFAIGDGSNTYRTLSLSNNIYAWVEAILPVDNGVGGIAYKWGQFQMGPYVDEDTLQTYYGENTLYSSFNVSIQMYNDPPLTEVMQQHIGGEDIYITDYATNYTLRATVSDATGFVEGVTVNYATVTVAQLQAYQTNPTALLAVANNLGTAVSGLGGVADLVTEWNATEYDPYNPGNPTGTAYVLLAYVTLLSTNYTGFVLVPTGYLTPIFINSSLEIGLDPAPPPSGLIPYYLVQKGVNYQLTTRLFEFPDLSSPLEGRIVRYYILDESDKTSLLLGTLNPDDLRLLGSPTTDSQGNTTIQTIEDDVEIFTTFSVPITVGDVYYIAAIYGQNYTFIPILYFDGKYSTIDSSSYLHSKAIDGDFFNPDVDIYVYQQPPGGSVTPLIGEDIDVWIVEQTVYDNNDDDLATLEAALLSESVSVPYGAYLVASGVSDGNGFFNTSINVNVNNFGPGYYRLVILYLDTWNISAQITFVFPPAMMLSTINFGSSMPDQIQADFVFTQSQTMPMYMIRIETSKELNCLIVSLTKDVML